MAQIGSGWYSPREDGELDISMQFDKAILPLEIKENIRYKLKAIPDSKRTDKEKSPNFTIICYIPEDK
jgi:hypothetical protein